MIHFCIEAACNLLADISNGCHLDGSAPVRGVDFRRCRRRIQYVPDHQYRRFSCNGVRPGGVPVAKQGRSSPAYRLWFEEELALQLKHVSFDHVAAFDNTKISGPVEFELTNFKGRANFLKTLFNTSASFDLALFHDQADFILTEFKSRVYFKGETFKHYAFFSNAIIKDRIYFENVNCQMISFLGTDVRSIDFINCDWLSKNGRILVFDELCLFKSGGNGDAQNFRKVEILYRKLKQKYKEEHDEQEASRWHYNEKDIFRKSNPCRRYLPSISTLYWLLSGYGERPVRAGFVLLLTIFTFSSLLLLTGLALPNTVTEVHGIRDSNLHIFLSFKTFWASFLNTIKYVTFQRDPYFTPSNWLGESVKLIAQLVIPIQRRLFSL